MDITDIIGGLPYRMAFAGGWIDQPFVSQHNPTPPGSMVVVALEPTLRFMDRCGMGTSTRRVAARLWGDGLPARDPAALAEPSGSQDMIGLIYPGVNRLDYAFDHEGGYFPVHVASCNGLDVARWLEESVWMVPVAPRPPDYSPLEIKNLDPEWIRRLGQSGRDCYDAILVKDLAGLGEAMNESMRCWAVILPGTVRHQTLTVDLMSILGHYRARYAGAMYSGCGGGYLYVVSDEPVPGGFRVKVRV